MSDLDASGWRTVEARALAEFEELSEADQEAIIAHAEAQHARIPTRKARLLTELRAGIMIALMIGAAALLGWLAR